MEAVTSYLNFSTKIQLKCQGSYYPVWYLLLCLKTYTVGFKSGFCKVNLNANISEINKAIQNWPKPNCHVFVLEACYDGLCKINIPRDTVKALRRLRVEMFFLQAAWCCEEAQCAASQTLTSPNFEFVENNAHFWYFWVSHLFVCCVSLLVILN